MQTPQYPPERERLSVTVEDKSALQLFHFVVVSSMALKRRSFLRFLGTTRSVLASCKEIPTDQSVPPATAAGRLSPSVVVVVGWLDATVQRRAKAKEN